MTTRGGVLCYVQPPVACHPGPFPELDPPDPFPVPYPLAPWPVPWDPDDDWDEDPDEDAVEFA